MQTAEPARHWVAATLLSMLVASTAASASAQDISPGLDLFRTDPSTVQSFNNSPIPADFFGPGSDPFTGSVFLGGAPLGSSPLCPLDPLNEVDTIIRRNETSQHPSIPSTDVIQIEIVELSLVSVDPITVTYNGGSNPELWDVQVALSVLPQQTGQMTITKQHPNGGVFDSVLPVWPRFTFVRVGVGDTRVLDAAEAGMQPIVFLASEVPWTYADPWYASCTSNFCVNPDNLTVEQSQSSSHAVYAICPVFIPDIGLPAAGSWALMGLVVAITVASAFSLRRRLGNS